MFQAKIQIRFSFLCVLPMCMLPLNQSITDDSSVGPINPNPSIRYVNTWTNASLDGSHQSIDSIANIPLSNKWKLGRNARFSRNYNNSRKIDE